jgi:hypothetical protein
MRWLAVTVALLGACAALVGAVYFRDRVPSHWLPPERPAAHADAMAVAAGLGGTCPRECSVKLLGHPRPDHWVERIAVPAGIRCVDIDVVSFATGLQHGFSGITEVNCQQAQTGAAN